MIRRGRQSCMKGEHAIKSKVIKPSGQWWIYKYMHKQQKLLIVQ